MKYDIVIVGGGIMGSAAAYFLAASGRAGRVAVVEPDPGYARATTPAGAGGLRRLMSRPENIRMSQFSLDFYADFPAAMATPDNPAEIGFTRQGYLFLATAEGAAILERNFETQCAEAVPAVLLDVRLPVEPLGRVQHFWRCKAEIEPLPLVKDESGAFLRPEGAGFVGGCPSWQVAPGFIWDQAGEGWDRGHFATYFEATVWPLVAAMVPKFETLRLERTWGGHYAQNTFDGNMIIGRFAGAYENILTACGFSGHGIMHAPSVGRALAELALDGEFQTLDLARLGIQRVIDNAPYPELGIR